MYVYIYIMCTYIYIMYIVYIYIWYRRATPPSPPPAMVMVPRVGCTISLESNYHARYLCFPAPPAVGWVGCSMYVPT